MILAINLLEDWEKYIASGNQEDLEKSDLQDFTKIKHLKNGTILVISGEGWDRKVVVI